MAHEREAVGRMLGGEVPPDAVLMVHSGLRRLAAAGHHPGAIIEALVDAVPAGTLAMPAMSWRISTPANPTFDELATPSHVGALAELFRMRYATHRSLHPTHSVAAVGRRAGSLTAEHHLGTTPCAANSPYGLMRGLPAYVVMLDCGLERCTAIHLPEELVAPDIYLIPEQQATDFELRDRHGATHRMRLRGHRRLNRCFEKFESMLEAQGRLRRGAIDGVPFLLCLLGDLLDEVLGLLARDPTGTLAPEGVATRLSGPSALPDLAGVANVARTA